MARTFDEYTTDRYARLTEEGQVAVAVFSHVYAETPVPRQEDTPIPSTCPFRAPGT